MIIPILGKVTYQITLDPSVWIFDDRKIRFEDAFQPETSTDEEPSQEIEAAKRWDKAVYPDHSKPPVNRSISRMEGKDILENSYVIPLQEFIENAEVGNDAEHAVLETNNGEVSLSIEQLLNSYMLFSWNGKQLKNEGPAHLYFKDGSNRETPIKGIQKIRIV